MPEQLYSRDNIISRIKELYFEREDLRPSSASIRRLVGAAIRYFGSWRKAVESAGIDYSEILSWSKEERGKKMAKWTKESIIAKIKEIHQREEDLTAYSVMNKYLSLYNYARRKDFFGSWKKALEAAAINYYEVKKSSKTTPPGKGKKWLKSLVIQGLKDLKTQGIPVESRKQMMEKFPNLTRQLEKLFKGWNKVLEKIKEK